MPNQADRYDALRLRLIDAAEHTISESGLAALKARDLARAAGCSVGTIYNVFAHLDELILCVGSRTLAMLDGALAGVQSPSRRRSAEAAVDDLVRLAAYPAAQHCPGGARQTSGKKIGRA